jgi:dTDP-4-dehydrorhamnose reductase
VRVVVFGAEGQLGRELARVLPAGARLVPRRDADVRDAAAVAAVIAAARPDVVVNCAADNRVDAAEADPEEAFATNAAGAAHVATAAAAAGALLVHTSTDYVFPGDRSAEGPPYLEHDRPAPRGAYARSKYEGERRVGALAPRAVIVRTAGLYAAGGSRTKGGSFVDRVLARARRGAPLRVVTDQVTSPTWARDAARVIAAALPRWLEPGAPLGIHHVSNTGACSWWELARAALELTGLPPDVEPVDSATFGAAAPRPPYSALASARLDALGLAPLRPWRAALAAYLAEAP